MTTRPSLRGIRHAYSSSEKKPPTRMATFRCPQAVHQCFNESTATHSVIDLLEHEHFM
ncbi:hypothetical protein PISMIDRAFT_686899, partial [Pisolithus microcarpus 441]